MKEKPVGIPKLSVPTTFQTYVTAHKTDDFFIHIAADT
jgi:hypothetical protein